MTLDSQAETTELTDEQIDDLVTKAESPNRDAPEREMTAAPEAPAEEFEITHGGKQIKATRDQLIKWAQQGYDYPQKAQKLNQERMQWDNSRTQWEQKWGVYKQVDDWASKNPDKWTALQESLNNMNQPGYTPQATAQTGQQTDRYAPVIENLRSELSELKTVAQTWQEQQAQQKAMEEDQKLDQEIKSIQAKYPDLDFTSPDETGKTLENKVVEFAIENGIKSFTPAFKAFYHDELISRAQAQAKQNVSKNIQANSKLGLIGKTPTPTKGIPAVRDVKKQSYEDIMDEIREERAQGRY